jgi:hypothetical protein
MPITLCIPKVKNKYSNQEIYDIFSPYNFGRIEYIHVVPNNINSWKVYIKYYYWFYNEKNNNIKKLLSKDNACFKILINEIEFWKCFIAASSK